MTHPEVFRGAGPFDALTMLRATAAGDLDANEATPTALNIGQVPHKGITVRMVVPQATGTSPTLDVTVEVSDTQGGTYNTIASFEQINAAGEYAVRFSLPYGRPWMRYTATVGGTTPNFGAVQIGVTIGGF